MLAFILKNRFLAKIFLIQKNYNNTWYVSKSKYDYLIVGDRIDKFVYLLFILIETILLQNYLKFEQSSGTPARIQVLYERAITDFPLSPDLWLDYTRYLDKTLKVSIPLLAVIVVNSQHPFSRPRL